MARRQSIDPLFDEEPKANNLVRYALIGGIVVIVGFIVYAALAGGKTPQGPVPVIRADATPWTRPVTETGGMEIPNQDSTVFELMDKKDTDAATIVDGVEMPPAEELVDTSEDKSVDDVVDETVNETPEKLADKPVDETADKQDVIGGLIEETATMDKVEDKPVDKAVDEAAAAKAKAEAAKKAAAAEADAPFNPNAPKVIGADAAKPSGKTVQVRLGSVPGSDKSAAAGEFNRLKGLAAGGLSGASPSYEPVTLDGKGSFVRINVSMDEASANKLCDTLSAKGAPCLILGQ